MRSLRFLILVVLAAGFGAWAYYDSKKDVADTTTQKAKVFADASGKIEELEIHTTAGIVTKLKKSGDTWQIAAPEPADADSSEVGSVVSSLESLEEQRTVDEHPASPAAFGVSPARLSIAFRQSGDATLHQLNIGNKSPTGGDTYAQVEGQPKVFLISSYVEDSLNKSTFDLRDKTVLKFSKDGVDSLTIESAGSPAVVLAKKGPDWLLTKPVEAKADFGSVDNIVNRLSQVKMKSIVAPGSRPTPEPPKDAKKDDKKSADTKPADASPKPGDKDAPDKPAKAGGKTAADKPAKTAFDDADYKAYGLEKPQVTLTVGAGSTRATLAVGGRFDDTSVYARDLSRPVVFTVEKALVDDVKKKADDLRVKDVFEFRAYTASSIEFSYGGTTYAFEKQKTPPKDAKDTSAAPTETWKQIRPAVKDVDQSKFNDLLSNVSNLRADKFADKPLASGEDIGVTATFGDAASPKHEQVTLRKSGAVVQGIRPGDSGPPIVPTADFDKVLAQVKELVGKK